MEYYPLNTSEYTIAILVSDWLYFSRHAINMGISAALNSIVFGRVWSGNGVNILIEKSGKWCNFHKESVYLEGFLFLSLLFSLKLKEMAKMKLLAIWIDQR